MGDLLVVRFPGRDGLLGGGPDGDLLSAQGLPTASDRHPMPRAEGATGHGSPVTARSAWNREQRLWWLLWAQCPGVGWVRLQALERGFGDLAAAWRAPAADLVGLPGWHGSLMPAVERFRRQWGKDPLNGVAGAGLRVLVPGDPRWPQGIEGLERPPLALWWQGKGALWSLVARRRAVAVVGTRRPSLHGLAMARAIGLALAQAGWPVVSGLAEGIDGAVHDGCLAGNGAPIGVLGTPLERVYPRHHGPLQRAVGQRGLLVSEQASGSPVRRGHFAGRNRLLVGLASAVVVVECPPGSGALHSAAFAWEQGLPLWVVPGDAARASSLGSNRLLARGATPVLSPEDLVTSLGPGPLRATSWSPAGPLRSRGSAGLGTGQARLLEAVGPGASLEEICQELGRPAPELAIELFDLECAGLLRAEPGLRWQRC